MHYVARAAETRRGARIAAMTFPWPVFGTMLQGLECCWLGQFGQYTERPPCEALVGYMNRVRDNGFDWALAECLAVVGQPELRMVEGRPRPAAVYRKEAAAIHARLGTRSLTSLLAPMAQWEYPLKALEELAFEARNKPGAAKKRGPPPRRRRLAWEIREDAGEVVARPREQHQYKSGTWSAGKPVSMKRLATSAATMEFLLEQDRAAAAKIGQARDWDGRLRYSMDEAALFELAGHPHVFDEAGVAMEVVRGEPELVVDEHEGGLRARLVPDDGDCEDYHVRLVGGRRCEVTRFTPGHKRLRAIVPEGGLDLPAAARVRLLDAVSGLASEVRIHGGIAGGAETAREIEADPCPRVRLEPSGAGLAAELVVEPVPGSGICFEPGAGGATVFAGRDGETVQARRDLAAERAGAERIVAACPALASSAAEPPWVLPDPAGALELLEQLHAADAPCLWPKGEPLKIVARAATSNLNLTVKSAAEWFSASGTLEVDEGRTLDLKQLFTLLDASPGSRFLELGDGEFIALTGAVPLALSRRIASRLISNPESPRAGELPRAGDSRTPAPGPGQPLPSGSGPCGAGERVCADMALGMRWLLAETVRRESRVRKRQFPSSAREPAGGCRAACQHPNIHLGCGHVHLSDHDRGRPLAGGGKLPEPGRGAEPDRIPGHDPGAGSPLSRAGVHPTPPGRCRPEAAHRHPPDVPARTPPDLPHAPDSELVARHPPRPTYRGLPAAGAPRRRDRQRLPRSPARPGHPGIRDSELLRRPAQSGEAYRLAGHLRACVRPIREGIRVRGSCRQ